MLAETRATRSKISGSRGGAPDPGASAASPGICYRTPITLPRRASSIPRDSRNSVALDHLDRLLRGPADWSSFYLVVGDLAEDLALEPDLQVGLPHGVLAAVARQAGQELLRRQARERHQECVQARERAGTIRYLTPKRPILQRLPRARISSDLSDC